MYEIYALGSASYIAQILNAVAALGGNGTYTSLASISLLIGVIMVALQSIMQGGNRFDVQIFLVSMVLFNVIFIPRASVTVHDIYTNEARTIDNVPFGLAFVGSTINQIGYTITTRMESAFSLPSMTGAKFAGPLNMLLNSYRLEGFGAANFGCTNIPQPGDNIDTLTTSGDSQCSVENSVRMYVRDCVSIKINRPGGSIDEIFRSEDAFAAMKTEYQAFTTGTFIGSAPTGATSTRPPGEGWTVTCKEAYERMNSRFTDAQFRQSFNAYVGSVIGSTDPITDLNNYIGTLGGASVDAQKFVLNMSLHSLINDGLHSYVSMQDAVQASAMMTAGAMQRNIQWAGEATLFSRLVKPLITFFEGMMYATAPFIAFLIGLGAVGQKLALKYLYLPIWVTMWMPVMAICNLYTNMIAQGKLEAAREFSGAALTSIHGALSLAPSLQDWLGTASMLASSVPALTMSLLFGGSVAMTALAGRLQSGDTVNEKVPAPDPINTGAAINSMPMAQADSITGVNAMGASNYLPNFSVGSTLRTSSDAQTAQVSRASAAASEELSQSLTSGSLRTLSANNIQSIGRALQGSSDTTVSSVYGELGRQLRSLGYNERQSNEIVGRTALEASASAGLGVKAGGTRDQSQRTDDGPNPSGASGPATRSADVARRIIGANADVSAGAKATAGVTDSQQQAASTAVQSAIERATSLSENTQFTGKLASSVTDGLTDEERLSLGESAQDTAGQGLKKAYSKLNEESQQLRQLKEASSSSAQTLNMDGLSLVRLMAGSEGAMGAIDKAMQQQPELRAEMDRVSRQELSTPNGRPLFYDDSTGNSKRAAAFMLASNNLLAKGEASETTDAVNDARLGALQEVGIVANNVKPAASGSVGLSAEERTRTDRAATSAAAMEPKARQAADEARVVANQVDTALSTPLPITPDIPTGTPQMVADAGAATARANTNAIEGRLNAEDRGIYETEVARGTAAVNAGSPQGAQAMTLFNNALGTSTSLIDGLSDQMKALISPDSASTPPEDTSGPSAYGSFNEAKQRAVENISNRLESFNVPGASAETIGAMMVESTMRRDLDGLVSQLADNPIGTAYSAMNQQLDFAQGTEMAAERKEIFRDDFIANNFRDQYGAPIPYEELNSGQQARADEFAEGLYASAASSAYAGENGTPGVANGVAYYFASSPVSR